MSWRLISEIVGDAVEIDRDARARFVAEACGNDTALRHEVERLIRAHDRAGGFLEPPPRKLTGGARAQPRTIEVAPALRLDDGRSDDEAPEARLPAELVQRIKQRLALVATLYALGYVVGYISYELVAHVASGREYTQSTHTAGQIVAVAFVLSALAVRQATRRRSLRTRTLIHLGLAFEVVGSLGIALVMSSGPPPEAGDYPIWGVSWICVWLIAFPVFVPGPPRKAAVASFLSASMGVVALGVWVLTGTIAWPDVETTLRMILPNYIAGALGWLGARVVFGMGVDLARARRLGSYTLVSPLGQGGMGEVWIAEHHLLARPAALKLVSSELLMGGAAESALERFETEARTTATLTSPHTVNLYDYGVSDEGVFYYVMELLEGLDLETLVRRSGAVPPERAVHFLAQCCASLAEAHERGLVHRDIKPANVFVCRQGIELDFVKVLDFGLVRTVAKRSVTRSPDASEPLVGTPGYIAPEVLRGSSPDARADLYSLACVGYWLVAGRPAFQHDDPYELLAMQTREQPAPPSTFAPDVPRALDDLLLRCLAADPARRPASAAALADGVLGVPMPVEWTQDRARLWWEQASGGAAIGDVSNVFGTV